MQNVDFRSTLPKWETKRQKYKRVMGEIEKSAHNVQRRLLEIESVYRIPLEDIYRKAFFLSHPGTEELYNEVKQPEPDVDHCIEVLEHGDIVPVSKVLGDKTPKHFYRTTKPASWRAYRFYHHKGYHADHLHDHTKEKHNVHHLEVDDWVMQGNRRYTEVDAYKEFINLVTHEIQRTKTKEAQAERRARLGSFQLLAPFEVKETFKAIRERVLAPERGHKLDVRYFDVAKATKHLAKKAEERLEDIRRGTAPKGVGLKSKKLRAPGKHKPAAKKKKPADEGEAAEGSEEEGEPDEEDQNRSATPSSIGPSDSEAGDGR